MTIQLINTGAVANDGTGDTARDAFGKINDNFSDTNNAASKLMATTAQAQAGTPDVIPDAEDVHAAFNQFGVGNINSPNMGVNCGTFGNSGTVAWQPGTGFGAGFQARYATNRRAQIFIDSTGALFWRWTISSDAQDQTTAWSKAIAVGDSITATSAAKWTTARTLTFTGGATGSGSIDGSGNVSIALATSAPTSAQVGAATAGLSAGDIGSYGFFYASTGAYYAPGVLIAGSSLRYANARAYSGAGYSSISPGGTWKCMGAVGSFNGTTQNSSTDDTYRTTLFLRVA